MATRVITVCDRCGRAEKQCRRLFANVRIFTDEAGSMDKEQVGVDLCPSCGAAELTRLLSDNVHVGQVWWADFRKRKRSDDER